MYMPDQAVPTTHDLSIFHGLFHIPLIFSHDFGFAIDADRHGATVVKQEYAVNDFGDMHRIDQVAPMTSEQSPPLKLQAERAVYMSEYPDWRYE